MSEKDGLTITQVNRVLQMVKYDGDLHTHISLSKAEQNDWQDLGSWP